MRARSLVFRIFKYLLLVAFLGGLAVGYVLPRSKGMWASPLWKGSFERTPARLARGKYIVENLGVCFYCHAERDFSHFSGPPIEGTLGQGGYMPAILGVWAANITPDVETGIGSWTDGEIVRAIREGVGRDGQMIAIMGPPVYSQLSDEDAMSIVVYLRALPPRRMRYPKLKRTWSQAWEEFVEVGLKKFPEPVPDGGHIAGPRPGDPVAARKYVTTLGACLTCHRSSGEGQAPFWCPSGFTYASNISPDESGIKDLTEEAFVARFKSYQLPGGGITVPPPAPTAKALMPGSYMPWTMLAGVTEEDLRGIYAELRTLPPVKTPPNGREVSAEDQAWRRGRALDKDIAALMETHPAVLRPIMPVP